MKKIYKKLIAAALGVSMLLSMVGCGQSSATDQTQESSEPTQTADESETKVLTIATAKELDNLTTLTMNMEKLFLYWLRNGDGMTQTLSSHSSSARVSLLPMELLSMQKA